jgi:uncharacterized C2H2 Zn-finger protein
MKAKDLIKCLQSYDENKPITKAFLTEIFKKFESENTYTCQICGRVFKNHKGYITNHNRIFHSKKVSR